MTKEEARKELEFYKNLASNHEAIVKGCNEKIIELEAVINKPDRMNTAELIARQKKLVGLESPYAGDVEFNLTYARKCLSDSLRRGESPIASHLLYTQVLNDLDPNERKQGIEAGLDWLKVADKQVFYTDLGWSDGMKKAKRAGEEIGIEIEERKIFE